MRRPVQTRWITHPALGAALCLGGGIAVAEYLTGVSSRIWLVLAGSLFLVTCFCNVRRMRALVSTWPLWTTVSLGALVLFIGASRYRAVLELPANHIAHAAEAGMSGETEITLHGYIAEFPARPAAPYFSLLTECDSIITNGRVISVNGRVQLRFWDPDPAAKLWTRIRYGQEISVSGKLKQPEPPRNPAEFDYRHYLAQQGIYAQFDARPGTLVISARLPSLPAQILTTSREFISKGIQNISSRETTEAVLRALLLGDRSQLGSDTEELFIRSGLMHLLAISGLHVLLIGMVLYRLLRPALIRLRWRWYAVEGTRALLTLTILVLYCFITGGRASVVRATVMTVVLMAGTVLQRPYSGLNVLGVAALPLLFYQPGQLFEPGFQLSFTAVGAITVLTPAITNSLPPRWTHSVPGRFIFIPAVVSATATLGTLPLTLYHFGRGTFAGILLNIPGIPAAMGTLLSGLLGALSQTFSPGVASILGIVAEWGTGTLISLAAWGSSVFEWLLIRHYLREEWVVGLILIGSYGVVNWIHPRRRWKSVLLGLALLVVVLWSGSYRKDCSGQLEILFFDVGHGDAILVHTPTHQWLLVDAGGGTARQTHGSRTIIPHLKRYGVDRLEAVLVSHPHADHLGGVSDVLQQVRVLRLITNGQMYPSSQYRNLLGTADQLGVARVQMSAGDTLHVSPVIRIRVLWPPGPPGATQDANRSSLVVSIQYRDARVLLTGDIDRTAERQLSRIYPALLDPQLVKVPHHGSATSSSLSLLNRLCGPPAVAVVSVGRDDRYGLPDSSVIRRWRRRNWRVLRTDREGALWFQSDGSTFKRIRWRD